MKIAAPLPLLMLTLAAVANQSWAQSYPTKSVRFIVGYSPGGATDLMARFLAAKLTDAWNQQVLVDNRPGAAGTVGADMVAKSPPDGYTLLMAASPEVVIAPSLYSRLPYDPLKDFSPITVAALGAFMLVIHPSVPARSVKDLIAFAKSRPNQLNFASGGQGTAIHLTGELFKTTAGIAMVHVPYKGSGPAVADLLGGQVHLMFESIPIAMPHARAGKLRVLGIATAKRSQVVPEVPTIAEAGLPGFEGGTWYALLAPGSTPKDVVAKLSAESTKILKTPETRELLSSRGVEPVGNTPEEFAVFMRSEIAKWAKVARDSGARVE
ncbi:MAG: tripartite tricarboxylate transporter substrate binding protein [Burkholderiales bacterium]|nr:tripartite tricarboxylate transporter substrate binding protein [Burkholderiales bacterium]